MKMFKMFDEIEEREFRKIISKEKDVEFLLQNEKDCPYRLEHEIISLNKI